MQLEELKDYIIHLQKHMRDEWSFMEMCAINDIWVRSHMANPLVHEMDKFIESMVTIGVIIDITKCYDIRYAPNKIIIGRLLKTEPGLSQTMFLGNDLG